jgi:hypothetical protein
LQLPHGGGPANGEAVKLLVFAHVLIEMPQARIGSAPGRAGCARAFSISPEAGPLLGEWANPGRRGHRHLRGRGRPAIAIALLAVALDREFCDRRTQRCYGY